MRVRGKFTDCRKHNRRKHHRYEAKFFYEDGEVFARMYTGHEKAPCICGAAEEKPGREDGQSDAGRFEAL